jgi:heme/copper-type cytochrome/quinol oxidase subunit 3
LSAYAVRRARPNGWWGMAVFVATEATLFGTMIGTYGYLRFHNAHWPPRHIEPPAVLTPALLTLALVLTTVPMQLAWNSARRSARLRAVGLIAFAAAVQTAYLAWQLHDYVDEYHRMRPQASAYASVYFTLLGTDHLHVLVGILLNLWLVLRLATGLTRYRLHALQAIVFYWYAVSVITVVVLLVQVSPHA